jgi:hypothetical protein
MHSLTSVLDRGEWSASRTGRFTSRERASGIHWIGSWVGYRACMDMVSKEKNSQPPLCLRYADRDIIRGLPPVQGVFKLFRTR